MRLLVVIPARGGSKGIYLKNIYPLNGKPLIEYSIDKVIHSNIKCQIVVSTDSERIASVASKYQQVLIIKRPDEISGDEASTESAIIHALEFLKENKKQEFDYVITLQATSPLIKSSTISSFVEEFDKVKSYYDAQLSLTETFADFWIKNSNNEFSRLYKEAPRRRQDRKPMYIENSAIYITSVQSIKETKSVLGYKTNGFIIDEIEGLDINNYNDIKLAEIHIKNEKSV